jgi:serine/threonine protein kinase
MFSWHWSICISTTFFIESKFRLTYSCFSLKPENVLVDLDGFVKLTDFGLSKEGVKGDREAKSLCGTAEYLSPEVLLSRQGGVTGSEGGYGKASDWWSFGALIYEMIVGIPPFYAKDRDTLYRNIKFHDPKLDYPFLSDAAKDLCSRLLDKDPAQRMGSGSDGTKEIRQHPWFKDIDWEKMYLRDIIPPYKPILDS